eukprot:g7620.t1
MLLQLEALRDAQLQATAQAARAQKEQRERDEQRHERRAVRRTTRAKSARRSRREHKTLDDDVAGEIFGTPTARPKTAPPQDWQAGGAEHEQPADGGQCAVSFAGAGGGPQRPGTSTGRVERAAAALPDVWRRDSDSDEAGGDGYGEGDSGSDGVSVGDGDGDGEDDEGELRAIVATANAARPTTPAARMERLEKALGQQSQGEGQGQAQAALMSATAPPDVVVAVKLAAASPASTPVVTEI